MSVSVVVYASVSNIVPPHSLVIIFPLEFTYTVDSFCISGFVHHEKSILYIVPGSCFSSVISNISATVFPFAPSVNCGGVSIKEYPGAVGSGMLVISLLLSIRLYFAS
jgi:hypothetical protein